MNKLVLLKNVIPIAIVSIATVFFPFSLSEARASMQTDQPLTVAESSDYKSTSLSKEVVEFVDWCANKAGHVNKIVFGETVEGRDMVAAVVSRKPYKLGQQDDRVVALVIGNIHSGECAGKEGLLMMLRELTHNPDHHWLDNMVLIIAPNYNADANDRVGKFNRRGQHGPENGMGRRENAQQLDLNRDFIKIESPEARSLVGLINKANPHLFIDCHTTNGSKHQYALTYDIPHNPAVAKPVREFLRQKMMPAVTTRMEEDHDTFIFYYGNFNRDKSSWTTYGHEPRYSTEYAGLRGRLSILSEAYSYISYKDRIFASKNFVSNCFEYVHRNADAVIKLLNAVDEEQINVATTDPKRVNLSLSAKVSKFDEKFMIKGYKDDKPHDYECDFLGKYDPLKSTPLPFAYVIPADHARIVDRLLMHGVKIERLSQATTLNVQVDTITDLDRAPRAFQKHKMVRAESTRTDRSQMIPKLSYIVRTAQPLGRLAAYMLESQSDDGFVVWNFFDEVIEVGKEYPVLRISNPVEFKSNSISEVQKVGLLNLDMLEGPKAIVPDSPAPTWGEGHQLELKFFGRTTLLDAESMSFAERAAPPFRARELAKLLVDGGWDEDVADQLASAEPQTSKNRKRVVLTSGDHSVLYVPEKGTVHQIGANDCKTEMINFSDQQNHVSFYDEINGLGVFDIEKDSYLSVQVEQKKDTLVGKLDWVYQEELYGRGNFKGHWLSPDGKRIAYLVLDESQVKTFDIVDHIPVLGETEKMNYPKAGDPNPTVQVHVSASNDATARFQLDLSDYDGQEILVSAVSWTPDGTQLLAQVQNRAQTWLDLVSIESDGNNQKRLFRDKTGAWIESPGDPTWLPDGSFVWISSRDGYKHLYRYSVTGESLGQMTKGPWEVRNLLGQGDGYIYFSAAKENAYDMDAYRISIENNELEKITSDGGTHRLDFSKDMKFFVDSVSTVTHPATHSLHKADGTLLRRLMQNSDDRLNYINIAKPRFFEIPAPGDQPMDAMLITPPDFDPSKKYPVLVHIYAGPQAPRVVNRFGGAWYLWHQMLAQKGYVIWMCDNRSASYRSAKNVWPIHRNLGQNELADIETGVEWIKRQSWSDPERIGIWGWSYGGYMTAYALTHSKTFKMGISGAPVTDWRNYDSIYTERLMGLPSDNPKGYETTGVNHVAGDLHGELLLIHGAVDDNVHMNNSMQFALALQKAGKQFDMMIYPENRHSIRDPEQARHLRDMMMKFVLENL